MLSSLFEFMLKFSPLFDFLLNFPFPGHVYHFFFLGLNMFLFHQLFFSPLVHLLVFYQLFIDILYLSLVSIGRRRSRYEDDRR